MSSGATPPAPPARQERHGSIDPSDLVYDRMLRLEHYVLEHWKPIVAVAAALLVVVSLALAVREFRTRRVQWAATAYFEATQADDAAARLSALTDVAQKYAGTGAGLQAAFAAAQIAFESGQYAQAQGMYEQVLQAQPESPMAVAAEVGRAAALEAQGNAKEAEAAYRSALNQHPDAYVAPQARLALARLLESQGNTEEALEQYRDVVTEHAGSAWAGEAEKRLDLLAPPASGAAAVPPPEPAGAQ